MIQVFHEYTGELITGVVFVIARWVEIKVRFKKRRKGPYDPA